LNIPITKSGAEAYLRYEKGYSDFDIKYAFENADVSCSWD
jgi:hypothetical protein